MFLIDGKTIKTFPFKAGTWNNFAIQADFDKKKVALYHSVNADPLKLVVPLTATTTMENKDFHVGALRLPLEDQKTQSPGASDFLYSGIYIEKDTLCVKISGCK
jgi:hypothetical protein